MSEAEIINAIACLEELDGYEAEAKKRGLTGEEIAAIHERRKALTPKRKKARRR